VKQWRYNTQYSGTIKVVNSAGSAVTGAVSGDFVKKLSLEDANNGQTVTVTEIDSSNLPGWYKVTFTPNAKGHWVCIVSHATYNPTGWKVEFYVGGENTVLGVVRTNTAQAGAASSITLDASASATTDFYKYQAVRIIGGTGVGQSRVVTAYNSTTKVATVAPNWTTNPDSTSIFEVFDLGISGDSILDQSSTVDTYTLRQVLKGMAAVLMGKASGGPNASVFRSIDDSVDRVTATTNNSGDRSAMTLNL
jgi:hypothetical protein